MNSPNHDRVVTARVARTADGSARFVAAGYNTPAGQAAALDAGDAA